MNFHNRQYGGPLAPLDRAPEPKALRYRSAAPAVATAVLRRRSPQDPGTEGSGQVANERPGGLESFATQRFYRLLAQGVSPTRLLDLGPTVPRRSADHLQIHRSGAAPDRSPYGPKGPPFSQGRAAFPEASQ